MSRSTNALRPTRLCLQCTNKPNIAVSLARRSFTATTLRQDEASLQSTPSPSPILDPRLVSTRKEERELIKSGLQPIGSRRRRAALQIPNSIPFEQHPYQCFQEARKILAADREEKLKQIEEQRKRIAKWQARKAEEAGGEASKKGRLVAMQQHLQHLKILADINDPVIKMRFEDGLGKMTNIFIVTQADIYSIPRGYEPSHLPIPCRPKMAQIPTPPPHAANNPNAHYPRYSPPYRPRRRSQPWFRPARHQARRIR